MDSAIVRAARESPAALSFRRFALVLIGCALLPPLLLGALVIVVDPYYVFGSPSLPGINAVRPYYETNIFSAKLHQMRRIRPGAVALGSSRVEVGLDPRHPGWADSRTFNFGLPGSTSYEVMLAFLHAQSVGQPLKQAVVGLDFFGFNIFFPRSRTQQEARFGRDATQAFAGFLANELIQRRRGQAIATAEHAAASPHTTQAQGRTIEPDGDRRAGAQRRAEPRHFLLAAPAEQREDDAPPLDWDEAGYIDANPEAGIEIALGAFPSGYLHYAAVGRNLGFLGGFP